MEIVPVVQLDRSVLKDDEWLKNIKAVGRRVEELYKMKLFLLLVLVFSFVVDAMPMFGSLSVRTSVKAKISAQNGDVSAKEVEQRAVKSTDLNEGIQLKSILKVKEHITKSKKRVTLNEERNQVNIIPNRADIATEARQQRIIEHWRDVLPVANQNNAASKLKTSSPSIPKEMEVKSKKRVTLNEERNQVMPIPNREDIAKEANVFETPTRVETALKNKKRKAEELEKRHIHRNEPVPEPVGKKEKIKWMSPQDLGWS